MDVTKFIAILERSALFFPCITTLIPFDKYEGFLPHNYNVDDLQDAMRKTRELLHVCSWHCNDFESHAMWKLYLKSNEGIAIQSTYDKFMKSLAVSDHEVNIGMVKYIDYDTENVDWTNVLSLALYKRNSFEHEKELRALILFPHDDNENGIYATVNLDILIDKVYLAPGSEKWIKELVDSILLRYGILKDVIHSTLDNEPTY